LAIDEVVGTRDNIDPPLLINSGTDFSVFAETSESQSQTEGETQVDPTVKDLKNRGKGKKKRKRSPSPDPPPIVELFTKKWEEDKEERKEDRAMMREELDGLKEVNMEMLGCMKSMADSFSRMTKG
jgi:hypothetical protein